MDILVHNVCEIDSAHRYQYLIKKINCIIFRLNKLKKN